MGLRRMSSGPAARRLAPVAAAALLLTGPAVAEPAADRPYAFPLEHKEPLDDAAHVRNAIARFNQVRGVTDAERDAAWARILAAAQRFGVTVRARDWRDLRPPRP